jgi:hypothetical protein
MNDDFMTHFRKDPPREFATALYERINRPLKTNNSFFRSRTLIASAATLFLVLVLLVASPQVRAFAQTILEFFIPAQGNTFPLQASPISPDPTPTIFVQGLADCKNSSITSKYTCAVAEAETALGFDVRQLPSDPQGYTFTGVSFDPTQGQFQLTYTRDGGELTITEITGNRSPNGWETTWGAVPAESVEKAKVNGFEAEFVRGMFVVKSQTRTRAEWEAGAPVQRLRWSENGMFFEITMNGMVGYDDALGKEWLIDLAESLK